MTTARLALLTWSSLTEEVLLRAPRSILDVVMRRLDGDVAEVLLFDGASETGGIVAFCEDHHSLTSLYVAPSPNVVLEQMLTRLGRRGGRPFCASAAFVHASAEDESTRRVYTGLSDDEMAAVRSAHMWASNLAAVYA